MKTIENLLISKGELERIYTGTLKLYLWRSLHKDSDSANPLYPDFEPREIRGILRAPDVIVEPDIRGVPQVISNLGQGTSLFDRSGTFGAKNWLYYEIPEGTEIPKGLIITKDSYNKKYKATHYTISPNYTMPKAQFIKLLDELAHNAQSQLSKVNNG